MYRAFVLFCKITNKSTIAIKLNYHAPTCFNTRDITIVHLLIKTKLIKDFIYGKTQKGFVRIVTIISLHHFISNYKILIFLKTFLQ